jgi:hypothetical protein
LGASQEQSDCVLQAPGFPPVVTKPCEICHLRNEHTEDVSAPVPNLPGACSKYAANACCSSETAAAISSDDGLYGPAFRWNKCYLFHKGLDDKVKNDAVLAQQFTECNRWFQDEECLYECDVNAGKWRKHPDCYDNTGSENGWQLSGMPIKASECDAFYEACKNMHLCLCSGPDCPEGAVPKSLLSLGLVYSDDRFCRDSATYCQKTVGQVHLLFLCSTISLE